MYMEGMAAMGFAERLKQKRKEAGLTQRELAERCGLTSRAIQYYEYGHRQRPDNIYTAQRIAITLHTSVEYLLTGSDASRTGGSVNPSEALKRLTEDLTELFLSEETSEVQLDNAMKALWHAYWKARGVE